MSARINQEDMVQISCALTIFGIDLEDLTAEAFLYYSDESRKHGLVDRIRATAWAGTLAWPILHKMGQFAPSTPSTLRAAVTRGQRSIEESVDRHGLGIGRSGICWSLIFGNARPIWTTPASRP